MDVSHDGDFDDSYDDVVDYIVDDFTFCPRRTLASTRGSGQPAIKWMRRGTRRRKMKKKMEASTLEAGS